MVTDKEYSITVEVPGVSEKDVKIEIVDNTMTIKGEKKQEKEEKEKDYYRVERSHGSFQRLLSLPEDANQDCKSIGPRIDFVLMNTKCDGKSDVKIANVTSPYIYTC